MLYEYSPAKGATSIWRCIYFLVSLSNTLPRAESASCHCDLWHTQISASFKRNSNLFALRYAKSLCPAQRSLLSWPLQDQRDITRGTFAGLNCSNDCIKRLLVCIHQHDPTQEALLVPGFYCCGGCLLCILHRRNLVLHDSSRMSALYAHYSIPSL